MKNPRLLTACLLASCTLLGAATETEPQVSITVEGEHRFIRANGQCFAHYSFIRGCTYGNYRNISTRSFFDF